MILLVQVANRHHVSEQLIEVFDAPFARGCIERDWQFRQMPVRLRFVTALVYDRPCMLQDFVSFGNLRHNPPPLHVPRAPCWISRRLAYFASDLSLVRLAAISI